MREPDFSHENRRAWKCHAEDKTAAHSAHLVTYLLNFPGAHPWWNHWMIVLVHLRDVPGAPPAKKSYPEAEYEFSIVTLNPDKHPGAIDPDSGPWHYLTPPDTTVQFHGVTEEQAIEVCRLAVKLMVDKAYSPDSDFREWWKQAIWSTIEHMTIGHPEGSA